MKPHWSVPPVQLNPFDQLAAPKVAGIDADGKAIQ
jgi:hypothetical protein